MVPVLPGSDSGWPSGSVVTMPPGRSVQGGVLGERRHHGQRRWLATEHTFPQPFRVGGGEVFGERIDDEPGSVVDLVLELVRPPPRVAREDAHGADLPGDDLR